MYFLVINLVKIKDIGNIQSDLERAEEFSTIMHVFQLSIRHHQSPTKEGLIKYVRTYQIWNEIVCNPSHYLYRSLSI